MNSWKEENEENRMTDRQTDRQTDRHTGMLKNRPKWTVKHTYAQI